MIRILFQFIILTFILILTNSCDRSDRSLVSNRYLALLKNNLKENNKFIALEMEFSMMEMEWRYKKKYRHYSAVYDTAEKINSIFQFQLSKLKLLNKSIKLDQSNATAIGWNWSQNQNNKKLMDSILNRIVLDNESTNQSVFNVFYNFKEKRKFGIKSDEVDIILDKGTTTEVQIRAMFESAQKHVDLHEFSLALLTLENQILKKNYNFSRFFHSKVSGWSPAIGDNLRPTFIPFRKNEDSIEYKVLLCFSPNRLHLNIEVDGEKIPTIRGIGKFTLKHNERLGTVKATLSNKWLNVHEEHRGYYLFNSDRWFKN